SAVPVRAERSLLPRSADAAEPGSVGSMADDSAGWPKALLGADGRSGARREHGSRSRLIPGSIHRSRVPMWTLWKVLAMRHGWRGDARSWGVPSRWPAG